jgi:hypothetical protein
MQGIISKVSYNEVKCRKAPILDSQVIILLFTK